MIRLIVIALILALPHIAHAIDKCRATDGRVDVSDGPCATTLPSTKGDAVAGRLQPTLQAQASPTMDPEQLLRAEPPRSVQSPKPAVRKHSEFAEATPSRLVAVIAVLEDLDGDGQDCEWALKGSGRSMAACARFLPQMMGNGAWSQAVAELRALERDRAFAQGQRTQIDHARRLIERASSSSRFANARLFSAR
ncbi:hypothetical protein [Piscinibacter sp.]|jgi:hypothetical protein|uniref:hypothetical protein n=1 Tax=Piscinibacter sp. TaxID=1903157 RepID=UPI00355ABB87